MAVSIPFLTSKTNYRLDTNVDDEAVVFDVRWNSRDEAWYFDMYEADDTPIAINVKVVLGVGLGKRSQHEFFVNYRMTAIDTSGQGLDPGYDDLNARVILVVQSINDLY